MPEGDELRVWDPGDYAVGEGRRRREGGGTRQALEAVEGTHDQP